MADPSDLAQKLEKINAIGIALSAERNVRNLLDMIVREARAVTRCDAGSLYIAMENQLSFEVSQSAVLGERAFSPFILPVDKSRISGYVASTGKWLNIDDVYAIPEDAEYGFQPDFDRMMGYRTKSVLAVPMQDREGRIIGVLQLINALDGRGDRVPENVVPFSQEYVRLVLSLASQAAVAIQNARMMEEIKGLFVSFIQFCAAEIDARDPCQAGHSRRVRDLAVRIAQAINATREGPFAAMSFSPQQVEALSYAAWLHDVGKIAVSEAILTKKNKISDDRAEVIRLRFMLAKRHLQSAGARDPQARAWLDALDDQLALLQRVMLPGPMTMDEVREVQRIAAIRFKGLEETNGALLTPEEMEHLLVPQGNLTLREYDEIRKHATHTSNFLHQIPFSGHLQDIPDMAGDHHEMLNGSGYPRRLRGDQISLQARILAVADIFDALTASDRPYKKALPVNLALGILREEATRGRLDADLVQLFIEQKPYSGMPCERRSSPNTRETSSSDSPRSSG